MSAAASSKGGVTFQKWVSTMSDEVYRLLLVSAFMLQITAVSFVPLIGSTLVAMHLCWMYSLYSFESHHTAHTEAQRTAHTAPHGSTAASCLVTRLQPDRLAHLALRCARLSSLVFLSPCLCLLPGTSGRCSVGVWSIV